MEKIKETLEEFINKVDTPADFDQFTFNEGIKVGAKWQAKRMYSEEDLRNAFKAGREGDMVFNNESPKYWDFDTYLQSLLTTT